MPKAKTRSKAKVKKTKDTSARMGKVEAELLTTEQVAELLAYMIKQPKPTIRGVQEAIKTLFNVHVTMGASETFKDDKVDPYLEYVQSIRATDGFSKRLAEEGINVADSTIAHTTNKEVQLLLLQWFMERKKSGGLNMNLAEDREAVLDLYKIVDAGTAIRDRGEIKDARVEKMGAEVKALNIKLEESERKLREAEAKQVAASAKLQELRDPNVMNSDALRNAVLDAVDEAMGLPKKAAA